MMKVVMTLTQDEYDLLDASKVEIEDWVIGLLNGSVDTWDGGIFLGFDLTEREVAVEIEEVK